LRAIRDKRRITAISAVSFDVLRASLPWQLARFPSMQAVDVRCDLPQTPTRDTMDRSMLAAAGTLWLLFSLWMLGPYVELPVNLTRAFMGMLVTELAALLAWSYGTEVCESHTCAPLAQAAGVAARIDFPIIALLVVVALLVRWGRHAAATAAVTPSSRP
jgi:hypothetical protein